MIVRLADLIAIRQDAYFDELSAHEISLMFDRFRVQLERMQETADAVDEITDAVLSMRPNKLLDSRILYHPIMYFLLQIFLGKLDRWCTSDPRCSVEEMDVCLKIILLFVHIAEQAPSEKMAKGGKHRTHVTTVKQALHIVRDQLDGIALNRAPSKHHHPDVRTLGLLTIKLLQDAPFYYRIDRKESSGT